MSGTIGKFGWKIVGPDKDDELPITTRTAFLTLMSWARDQEGEVLISPGLTAPEIDPFIAALKVELDNVGTHLKAVMAK